MPYRYPVSPTLREFLYDVLYQLQGDKEFVLKDTYRELGRTNSRAKKFANRASLEQILHILAMCGIQWTMVIFDTKDKPETLRQLFEGYRDTGENSANAHLNKLIKKRIYVTTDKQFIKYLGLSAQLIESDEFKRNMELLKVGYHIRQWTKKLNSQTSADDVREIENSNYFAKVFLSCVMMEDRLKFAEQDWRILLYLYINDTKYVHRKIIDQEFSSRYIPKKIGNALSRLCKQEFVQKDFKYSQQFKITGLGMAEINRIFAHTLNNIL